MITIEQFEARCVYMMTGAVGITNWWNECFELYGEVCEAYDNTYVTNDVIERARLNRLEAAIIVELERWK